jgi:hypothetical protein
LILGNIGMLKHAQISLQPLCVMARENGKHKQDRQDCFFALFCSDSRCCLDFTRFRRH